MEKLVLIDGNSLLNRAFYATPLFTTKNGLPTNGVFGFVKLMLKIISDKKPSHFAVAFDLHAPTFRHKMYDGYKAGRKPMPEELAVQMPILKEVLRMMNVKICELEGYEADDILGTLAKKFNVQTYIYTGDRDAYQLVDETTNVCYTRKGVSDILELSALNFKDEIGLTPAQIIDLKALMGDKSDNIPGVAGVGETSAKKLLERFETLHNVYNHVTEVGGALQKKLENDRENAFFSQKLATIETNAPIEISLGECMLKMPFAYKLKEKFAELEFKSLVSSPNLFKESESASENNPTIEQDKVLECTIQTVAEALNLIEKSTAETVACHYTERDFRFVWIENETSRTFTEYVMPLKEGLLDVGFYDYELIPVLKALYDGKKKIVSFAFKDDLHRLETLPQNVTFRFDDVSILKSLAEGNGNSDGLEYCLNANALSETYKAYGVYKLRNLYFSQLNDEEKKLYQNVELPLVTVLYDMEKRGVCVNTNALKEFSEKYQAQLQSLVEKIYALAGETFNVNSTQQLGKILFEKLKIGSGVKKTKTNSYKTTAEELEKYAEEHEIIRVLLRYRQIQKLSSTYVEGFKPLIRKGKVHTTYNQSNTSTGRLSSANPNLQNIPIKTEEGKELRKLFTASEGNVLVDADYSQIELRLLAHFSGCKELIDAYCKGEDIHTATASQVFNVPVEGVTSSMRREAKVVNFGIIYGMSAFGLGKDLKISKKRAQEYIDRYFETYSDVKTYMNFNVETAKEKGFVTTLLGRRRVINEIKSYNFNVRQFGERAAMNMPLQGSSADIIKMAMINVHKRLQQEKMQAKLVLQVHDELVIDCPVSEAEKAVEILKFEMENAITLKVPLTVEIGVGKNWFDSK